ncbi:tetratricopeptide repeat-containing S1 family peptidase [Fischerella sp. NIES-3754]|uniref:tetratricopeptide repeat-containing S1 family peptidase n=1 Tax=Fischerella sp. NIES-3754 TaxID=1752063 RepID=UPI00071F6F9B|nr:tetratricopeptide repeat-containing serine protease family protein [Fischerella sp. NIES-3754]BAU08523.1 tetratricopeptide TPR_2 repeat protein [Fischerella sp. NIES-3754]
MNYFYTLPPVFIGVSIVLVQSQVAVALSQQEVEQIAREITVRIVDTQDPTVSGSGVLIKHSGDTYTVLTAYHVVKDGGKYEVITPDTQTNQVKSVKRLPDVDLAVVEFSSSKDYKIAKIGNSDKATASNSVYVAGFPGRTAAISNPQLFFNKGQVQANGAAQRDGYNILYDNDTLSGMSGGAVLNEQGEVVAIHGRVDEQEIGEKSQSKIITGLGTTIYSALRQMLAVGVDVGVRPPDVVATGLKADDFYIRAYDKYDQKDYKGAIADYTSALKINPNDADAYNNRGVARSDLGDKQGAIADYTSALKINPNDADAYNNRGNARSDLGDKQGAITDFNSALKINPNDAEAYYNRGNARRLLGDKQGAIADYTSAIKINPNYDKAYNNRGNARRLLGDKQGAIADFNTALKINPNLAQAYGQRGIVRALTGDKQGGIADLQKAAELSQQQGNTELHQKVLEFIRKLQQ